MPPIFLSNGGSVLVDVEDFDRLQSQTWRRHGNGSLAYAVTNVSKGKILLMHREISKAEQGEIVDHVNGNGLDNRRSNLRICSHAENLRNQKPNPNRGSSQYKGVYWCNERGKWMSQIRVNGRAIGRKRFDSEVDAARFYDALAVEHFGKFARLNFPIH